MTAPPPPPWNETWRTVEARLVAALDEIARLTAAAEEAQAKFETANALADYADHAIGCDQRLYEEPCSCGFTDLLRKQVEAERTTGEGTR